MAHYKPSDEELIRFVYEEARMLDERRFDQWYDLFTKDGYYWVPLTPDQPDGINHTSLAYEDRLLLRIRIERLKSDPAAQRPPSRCHHLLQAPVVLWRDPARGEYTTRTEFHYTETDRDEQHVFVGTVFHYLRIENDQIRIRLKRINLLNCDAALPSIQLFP
jgi:3-phenylpropionate/cinnamic acid dioxygenase small subunit